MGLLVFILLLAGIDIGIKNKIDAAPAEAFPKSCPYLGRKIKLYQRRNAGFPFGILASRPEAVKLIPVAVTGFLAGALFGAGRKPQGRCRGIALAFLIAGALSNIFDRMKRGYVVDYLHVDVTPIKKIIFNLADVFICIGAFVYMLLRKERP